jgi:positive regulator of sigma E activity
MKQSDRHVAAKVFLIFIAELSVVSVIDFMADNTALASPSASIYVLCGTLLAYAVVSLYNRTIIEHQRRLDREIRTLMNVALRRVDIQDK